MQYHAWHAPGLLCVGLYLLHRPDASIAAWSAWLFVIGIVLFSGSLYVLAFTGTAHSVQSRHSAERRSSPAGSRSRGLRGAAPDRARMSGERDQHAPPPGRLTAGSGDPATADDPRCRLRAPSARSSPTTSSPAGFAAARCDRRRATSLRAAPHRALPVHRRWRRVLPHLGRESLLTLVTLGIYSAWAKVRKTRYFWQNTRLDGHAFDYHGDPRAILLGRIVALALVLGTRRIDISRATAS